jgi:hypothetical protein
MHDAPALADYECDFGTLLAYRRRFLSHKAAA